MTIFPAQFVEWMGNLDNSHKLGLFNGSLYEVLDHNTAGIGSAQVSAMAFNITCGYFPATITLLQSFPGFFELWLGSLLVENVDLTKSGSQFVSS
jgi:hypothetical protein